MTLLIGRQGDDELLARLRELLLPSPMTTMIKVDQSGIIIGPPASSRDGRRRRRRESKRGGRDDDSKSSYNGEQQHEEPPRHSCKTRYVQ
jgi:hypothetical protein